MKASSFRKAEKEEHAADCLVDDLFRFTLDHLFRRLRKKNAGIVEKILQRIIDGHGEQSLPGFMITGDRCYGIFSMLERIARQKTSPIFLILNIIQSSTGL